MYHHDRGEAVSPRCPSRLLDKAATMVVSPEWMGMLVYACLASPLGQEAWAFAAGDAARLPRQGCPPSIAYMSIAPGTTYVPRSVPAQESRPISPLNMSPGQPRSLKATALWGTARELPRPRLADGGEEPLPRGDRHAGDFTRSIYPPPTQRGCRRTTALALQARAPVGDAAQGLETGAAPTAGDWPALLAETR